MDQWNRIKSLETESHKYALLTFYKGTNIFQWMKYRLPISYVGYLWVKQTNKQK